MLTVQVLVQVKPECVEAFRAATIENARQSRQEPGVARFDVLQQSEEPNGFLLLETYRSSEAQAAHKLTGHYQQWRDAVAPMMAKPRTSTFFQNVFPLE